MTHEKFIKVVNRDTYLNPSYIVLLAFGDYAEIGEAVLLYGDQWSRERVYRKDVEHLIEKQ